ncbi:MAG: hypothetical protein ACI86M_003229, partial [Saprospiraceae bacterium]
NENRLDEVNLYFYEESRFGLMTLVGSLIKDKGIRPKVKVKCQYRLYCIFTYWLSYNDVLVYSYFRIT